MNTNILDKQNKYIVGVSGGVDSMTLLDMLVYRGYEVIVCHVNYHYRHDSNIDTQIVLAYCKKHNLTFEKFDVDHSNLQGNFQMEAREIRYNFFRSVYDKYRAHGVIVGHHYDDDVESKVMAYNQNRIFGFMGIKDVSCVKDMSIYRPLLNKKKSDLYKYALEHKVNYHEDYTNFMDDFYRDSIRNVFLKEVSKERLDAILLFCNEHNVKYVLKQKQIDVYLKLYKQNEYLHFSSIKDGIVYDVIYSLLKLYLYPPMISKLLIEEVIKQCQCTKPQIEVMLPDGYSFYKEYDQVFVCKSEVFDKYCLRFDEMKEYRSVYFSLCKEGNENEGVCFLDEDFPIVVRTILPGDRIKTKGGTKKVSRLFIDHKVPKRLRQTWPIVLNQKGDIILVPNIAKNIAYLYTTPNLYVLK